jgi:hypothetical protein
MAAVQTVMGHALKAVPHVTGNHARGDDNEVVDEPIYTVSFLHGSRSAIAEANHMRSLYYQATDGRDSSFAAPDMDLPIIPTLTVNPLAFIGHALDRPIPTAHPAFKVSFLQPSDHTSNPPRMSDNIVTSTSPHAAPTISTSSSSTPRKRRRLADIGRTTSEAEGGDRVGMGGESDEEGVIAPTPSKKELFQDDDDPTFDADLLVDPAPSIIAHVPEVPEVETEGGGRGKNLDMGLWSSKRLSDVEKLCALAEKPTTGVATDSRNDCPDGEGNDPLDKVDESPLSSCPPSPSAAATTSSHSSRQRRISEETFELLEDVFGQVSTASAASAQATDDTSSSSSANIMKRVRPSNLRPATSILRPQASFPNLPTDTLGSSLKAYSSDGAKGMQTLNDTGNGIMTVRTVRRAELMEASSQEHHA